MKEDAAFQRFGDRHAINVSLHELSTFWQGLRFDSPCYALVLFLCFFAREDMAKVTNESE